MEFLPNNSVMVNECVYDDRDERPIDGDFLLPEYCPDIAAVLKCNVTPYIQSRQLSADRLTAEGTVSIRVLYLDEERKNVRVCEFSQPFTSMFTLKNGVGTMPTYTLDTAVEYVNCRATSPRRLDIHGAFSIHLRLCCATAVPLLTDVNDDGLFVRRKDMMSSVPMAVAEKSFTINEVLDIGSRAPVETLLRTACGIQTEPPRIMGGKLVLKGVLCLKNIYLTAGDESDTEQVTHEIPFSQLFDAEGLEDELLCCVDMSVAAQDIRITPNQAGENTLLTVSIKGNASVCGYRTTPQAVLTDAYSAKCPVQQETRTVSFENICAQDITRHTVKETVDLPAESVDKVLDVWTELSPPNYRMTVTGGVIEGHIQMFMLARDKDGQVGYYERTAEYTLPCQSQKGTVKAKTCVLRTDFSQNGSKLEVRVDILLTCQWVESQSISCLTKISADESVAYPPRRTALKLYYADEGESLWEIAKCCRTSVESIMAENNLDEDVLVKNCMLIIPVCG